MIESAQSMNVFGKQLGALLRGGECIELVGDIGAGKTTMTKGIAQGMGIEDTIQSPTFTISRLYDQASGPSLAHYDFYRLQDAGIMKDELHDVMQDDTTVTVIEWADVVAEVLPGDRLQLFFTSPTETSRTVRLTTGGPRSEQVMKGLEV